MVIMAVVVIMMMINLVVLKIRLISGTKLENDGERIASYNQVFPDIKRFFSFSTILTILLQQWPGYLEAKERTWWWRRRRPMKMRDPRFVSRQDLLKELTCSGGKMTFHLWNAILLVLTISIAWKWSNIHSVCIKKTQIYTMRLFVSIILNHVARTPSIVRKKWWK